VDPKPTFGVSPYSVFKTNPIWFNDPLGDTTIAYNLQGVKIGTLNDGLKNQVHFFNVDADKGAAFIDKINSLKPGERDAWAKEIRKHSIAFMGEKSASSLKSMASKSLQLNREVGFEMSISSSSQVMAKEIKLPSSGGGDATTFTLSDAVRERYTYSQQTKIFGLGHTHYADYERLKSLNSKIDLLRYYGKPTYKTEVERAFGIDVPGGHDYKSVLPSTSDNPYTGRTTPLLIASPVGVTIYNNNTVNQEEQTQLLYEWFKR